MMVPYWTSTPDLMARNLPPLEWIVSGRLPEGLSILIGRPKLGKSQLALNLSIAVASGGSWLGEPTGEPGDALYVDLELGQRRVQGRLADLFPSAGNMPDLSRLGWVMPDEDFPALHEGLIDRLEQWHEAVPRPRLVVIDVYQNVAPPKRKNANAYEADSAALKPLRDWANRHHLAVLLVHHPRKGESIDPLEMGSGSFAMTSVPNLAMILDRTGKTVTLYARGHDIAESKTALRFDAGWWSSLGDADNAVMSAERLRIMTAIRENKGPMTPLEISDDTGMLRPNVRKLLRKMDRAGELKSVGAGRYDIGGRNTGHIGHSTPASLESALQNNGMTDSNSVTAEVARGHSVTEAVTPVTTNDQLPVTDLTPYIEEDISPSVTSVTEVTPPTDLVNWSNYLLRWLQGAGGTATHREAHQRCHPNLNGDQILAASEALEQRGQVTIDTAGPRAYRITAAGTEAVRLMTVDPRQSSLFDLV